MIEEEILNAIKDCKENLLKLSSFSKLYIKGHDEYIYKSVRDSSLLKKKIIEKIVGVFDNE
jgi:hypothetical protein